MNLPFIILGLGNPGRDYRETRHNIGFMCLDRLAITLDARFTRLQSKSLIATAVYQEHKVILAKPQTFMNLSGQAARGLMRFYKIPLSNLMIVHDDLDLPFGAIRIRPAGGSSGQKGMTSIIEQLDDEGFPRLRLGIGRPPGQRPAADYVLETFTNREFTIITDTLTRATEALLLWVREGLDSTMNRYNSQNSER